MYGSSPAITRWFAVAMNPSGGFTERGSRSDGTVPTHSCSPVQPGTGIRRPAFDALIGSSPRTR